MTQSETIGLINNMDEAILMRSGEIADYWGYLKTVRCFCHFDLLICRDLVDRMSPVRRYLTHFSTDNQYCNVLSLFLD